MIAVTLTHAERRCDAPGCGVIATEALTGDPEAPSIVKIALDALDAQGWESRPFPHRQIFDLCPEHSGETEGRRAAKTATEELRAELDELTPDQYDRADAIVATYCGDLHDAAEHTADERGIDPAHRARWCDAYVRAGSAVYRVTLSEWKADA